MENSMKFTLAIDKLNKKIAELNIKLSKNPDDTESEEKLQKLLYNKNVMYRGSSEEFEVLIEKYGRSN